MVQGPKIKKPAAPSRTRAGYTANRLKHSIQMAPGHRPMALCQGSQDRPVRRQKLVDPVRCQSAEALPFSLRPHHPKPDRRPLRNSVGRPLSIRGMSSAGKRAVWQFKRDCSRETSFSDGFQAPCAFGHVRKPEQTCPGAEQHFTRNLKSGRIQRKPCADRLDQRFLHRPQPIKQP